MSRTIDINGYWFSFHWKPKLFFVKGGKGGNHAFCWQIGLLFVTVTSI